MACGCSLALRLCRWGADLLVPLSLPLAGGGRASLKGPGAPLGAREARRPLPGAPPSPSPQAGCPDPFPTSPAFLLGYVSSRVSCSVCGDFLSVLSEEGPYEAERDPGPAPLYWADLREMFQRQLNEEQIEGTIR